MSATSKPPITHQKGEPSWEIAELFPPQGYWDDMEYLTVTRGTNRLVELSDGRIEVLTVPTEQHQQIFDYLYLILRNIATAMGGKVFAAGLRIRLWEGKFRAPDIVLLRSAADPRRHNEYWDGADLVVEIISDGPEDRRRDLVLKRQEYAQAGIPEYWIVDPEIETLTVLTLRDNQYAEHGVFARDMTATSPMFHDLRIEVSALFDAN